jgi:predicted ATPase
MLHGRIGEALESMYPVNLDDHGAKLAYHFARGGNPRKAAEYCMRAIQQCGVRGARAEAIEQFERGLEQLQKLPDDDRRAELELDLRNSAFAALFEIEGSASLEMEQSSHACSRNKASAMKPGRCSRRSTTGSPRASTQQI